MDPGVPPTDKSIANRYGLHLQTCETNGDFSRYDIQASGCTTLDNYLGHDPMSPLLSGNLEEGNQVIAGVQKSLLRRTT